MTVTIRQVPPDYSGSLKSIPGIPPPSCHLLITRPFDECTDRQKFQKNLLEERRIEQRVGKIIRRLLLKAGIPVLSTDQWLESNPDLYFKVSISLSLLEPFDASVEMRLIQAVLLARDPTIKIEAVTWEYARNCGFYRIDPDDEYQIQNWIYQLVQSEVRQGIHNLVWAYKSDNHIRDKGYDTGPLNEN
jgi:hypothetical protein